MEIPIIIAKPMMEKSVSEQISNEDNDIADMFRCGIGYGRKPNPPVWVESLRTERFLNKKKKFFKRYEIRFKKLNRMYSHSMFDEKVIALAKISALLEEYKRLS